MRLFRVWTLLLLVGLVGFQSGCSLPPKASDLQNPSATTQTAQRVFRVNLATEPPTLDPIRTTDLTSYTVVSNLMRGLTQFGPKLEIQPAVAKRWTISPDGLLYTFYLDPKARWSDGKPLIAQHFVDAWRRALLPNEGAEYAFFLFDVHNAKAYFDGQIKDFTQVGIQAVDAHTLQVRLNRPVAFFLGLTACPILFPARLDVIQRYGERFTEAGHLVSNGPYRLQEWVHDDHISLEPNPYYAGPHPKVDAVHMAMVGDANASVMMYENGDLDYIEAPTSLPQFDVRRLKHRVDAKTIPVLKVNYIGFNTKKPPFDNPKVRQAFAAAIDRTYFPRLLQSGELPWTSWIPPGLPGVNSRIGHEFNPDKAKQLLAEAGYSGGKGFPALECGYVSRYDVQKEMEIVQFLWKQVLGVDVRLVNMEWKVYLSRLRADTPQIYRLQWFADYPDADTFMSLFITGSGNNYSRWQSTQYDQWVGQAVQTRNLTQRKALYDKAQRLLLEKDTVIVPIYVGEKLYLLNPRVRGFSINPLNVMNLERLQLSSPALRR